MEHILSKEILDLFIEVSNVISCLLIKSYAVVPSSKHSGSLLISWKISIIYLYMFLSKNLKYIAENRKLEYIFSSYHLDNFLIHHLYIF